MTQEKSTQTSYPISTLYAEASLPHAKRYDALAERFETAKAQLDKTQSAITQRQAQKKMMENFMAELHRLPETVDYFDEGAWYALVDFLTVYSKDDVRFTFKNGMEIRA